jgi:hypothetical protein
MLLPCPTRNSASLATIGRAAGSGQLAVYHPLVAAPLERGKRNAGTDAHAGALEEIVVELEAADRVADDMRIARVDRRAAEHGRAEAPDVLDGQPGGAVLFGIELEQPEHPGRDPPGTDLVTGEARAVEDDDIPAGAAQHPRAGGPGGAAADDYRIAVSHCAGLASP